MPITRLDGWLGAGWLGLPGERLGIGAVRDGEPRAATLAGISRHALETPRSTTINP